MTATAMLIDLNRSGIRLEARGERLHVEAKPGTITNELRRLLTENKANLLAELRKPTPIREQLHRLAADAGLPASVVDAIDDDEVTLYDCGLSDLTLRDWLRARALNSTNHPAYIPASRHHDKESTR